MRAKIVHCFSSHLLLYIYIYLYLFCLRLPLNFLKFVQNKVDYIYKKLVAWVQYKPIQIECDIYKIVNLINYFLLNGNN